MPESMKSPEDDDVRRPSKDNGARDKRVAPEDNDAQGKWGDAARGRRRPRTMPPEDDTDREGWGDVDRG